MSKELIEKLKKLVENVEKISKGGPGSGPREGQRNRAGTGSGSKDEIVNSIKYTNYAVSRQGLKDAFYGMDKNQLKGYQQMSINDYANDSFATIANNMMQADVQYGKLIGKPEYNTVEKELINKLTNDKYTKTKVYASYSTFKSVINNYIKGK